MRQRGVYRSVEYRLESLTLHNAPLSSTRGLAAADLPAITATLRPLKALLPRFERAWPVVVPLEDARLVPYYTDVFACALVTLAVSAGFLLGGVFGPRLVAVYSIPSESMYPTLRVGDALLVEKMSLRTRPPADGEIVLFRPPTRLQRIVRARAPAGQEGGGVLRWSEAVLRRNDLFVKRVVAIAGDVIEIRGKCVRVNGVVVDKAAPGSPNVRPITIPDGFLFVVGDNADHSLDSRFWGLLPVECVVGRPVARVFPLDRIDIGV